MTNLWTAEVRQAERSQQADHDAMLARVAEGTSLTGRLADLLREAADRIDSRPPTAARRKLSDG